MRTWKEIRSEIINLGFENSDIYEKHKDIFIEAVNRACTVIACGVCPLIEKKEIKKEEFEDTHLFSVPKEGFYEYAAPVCTKEGNIPLNVQVLLDKRVYIEEAADCTLWYKRLPKKIDFNTQDNEVIDLVEPADMLLPLLACYYIWQEDDERKACAYRNDYEALKAQLFEKRQKAYVYEGVSI